MIIEDKEKIGFCERILVISNENSSYPNVSEGMSSWFAAEFYGYYENGIEIWCDAAIAYYAIIFKDGSWILSDNESDLNGKDVVNSFRAQGIARIPYCNIVRIEFEADDYYRDTRIYCDFNINGNPYEGIYVKPYVPTKEESRFLDNSRRIKRKSDYCD